VGFAHPLTRETRASQASGTTRAVVIASVTTLVGDYFLSAILLQIFHAGKA
jgi:hypothetical protein